MAPSTNICRTAVDTWCEHLLLHRVVFLLIDGSVPPPVRFQQTYVLAAEVLPGVFSYVYRAGVVSDRFP